MRVAFLTTLFLSLTFTLRAATLVGTQVAGALYFPGFEPNYFDPISGHVPAGYLNTAGNTVTISASAVEYGYDDGYIKVTADFTGTQLAVTALPASSSHYFPLELIFTNTVFTNLSSGSDSFPSGGLSSSLDAGVITLYWPGGNLTQGVPLQAIFTINAPPTPQLSIQLTPTNSVVLSWPEVSTGFNLQQNTSVASTNWVPVSPSPTLVNGRNQVIVSPPVGSRFYRLTYP